MQRWCCSKKLPCDCFGHLQIATVDCTFDGNWQLVCKHSPRTSRAGRKHFFKNAPLKKERTSSYIVKVVKIKRHKFILKANNLRFLFLPHFSQFYNYLVSSWRVFADNWASSMQSTSNCSNLLPTEAIAKRFLVQHPQFHLMTGRNLQQTVRENTFSFANNSVSAGEQPVVVRGN